ncbi:YceI family protein, partial [Streptomyces sp. NPDC006386]|uniref:YceI family protein n=1 Tax=Streptomyces sp. NPDC006386 TaxID=3156762 RepID=UPI0033A48A91
RLVGVLALDAQAGQQVGRHALAGRPALARDGRVHVLAGPGVVPGALPLPDVLEQRPLRDMPAVEGGGPLGVEQLAALPPGQGGEGDRGVRPTTINRSDWGLTYNSRLAEGGAMVSEKVRLQLDIAAIRTAPSAG